MQADIDNNGTIDYGEFLAATMHLNKMEREENLIAAFSFFDKDSSGYITIDELQQASKEFGLDDVYLDGIIEEIDQDNVSVSLCVDLHIFVRSVDLHINPGILWDYYGLSYSCIAILHDRLLLGRPHGKPEEFRTCPFRNKQGRKKLYVGVIFLSAIQCCSEIILSQLFLLL